MSYSQTWLEDPAAIRMILVVAKYLDIEANNTEKEFLISTTGYTTTDGKVFDPVIQGEVTVSESFGSESSISMSWGDIEIGNRNGEFDSLLDSTKYIWSNRSVKIYYGDPGWSSSLSGLSTTFLKVFDGVIYDVDTRNRQSFNIKIRDKLERLNARLTEATVGTYGTWASGQQNQDEIKPVTLGEVFNIKPVLIDPSQLEYIYNCSNPQGGSTIAQSGESELLIEVRDNGAPIYVYNDVANYGGITHNSSQSTFKLNSPPAGELTVSVQGARSSVDFVAGTLLNTYNNTIANLIAVTAMKFGKANTRFLSEDIDWINFKNFNDLNPVPAGVTVTDATNVLEICQSLALSIGANVFVSREGKLQLIKYGTPYGTSVTITEADMYYDSFEISKRLVPQAAQNIAWGKNWSVQQNLTTAIPADHKQDFGIEWRYAKVKDQVVADKYKLETEVVPKETLLISTDDAEDEANRLLNFYKVPKTTYRFLGTTKLFSLKIGQPVVLYHHRFGLSNGVNGQVVTLNPNWTKGEIEVEVVV
jgi:hypothetical protein